MPKGNDDKLYHIALCIINYLTVIFPAGITCKDY